MEIKLSIIMDYQFVKGHAGRQKLYWDEVCISMSNLHGGLSAPLPSDPGRSRSELKHPSKMPCSA